MMRTMKLLFLAALIAMPAAAQKLHVSIIPSALFGSFYGGDLYDSDALMGCVYEAKPGSRWQVRIAWYGGDSPVVDARGEINPKARREFRQPWRLADENGNVECFSLRVRERDKPKDGIYRIRAYQEIGP